MPVSLVQVIIRHNLVKMNKLYPGVLSNFSLSFFFACCILYPNRCSSLLCTLSLCFLDKHNTSELSYLSMQIETLNGHHSVITKGKGIPRVEAVSQINEHDGSRSTLDLHEAWPTRGFSTTWHLRVTTSLSVIPLAYLFKVMLLSRSFLLEDCCESWGCKYLGWLFRCIPKCCFMIFNLQRVLQQLPVYQGLNCGNPIKI